MNRELDFVDECYKGSDLSLLKKLTLVIPTYNRNFYLSRCLWYHAHFPFGQIIVADSSPEEKKIVNRDTVRKIREIFGSEILYLEYEPETEKYGGDIYRKWGDAILHVNSEYSEVCTDKEFVNPTVCCDSILFLENNPDYVSAFGKRADAILDSTVILTSFGNMGTTDDDTPLDRLTYCCCKQSGCPENVFHVNRQEVHKLSQNNHLNHGINDIRYGEVIGELQYFLQGKIKIFETIGRIRENTHTFLDANLKTKSESSCSRYPELRNYPHSLQKKLHKYAIECLYNLLPYEEQTDSAKKIISDNCELILQWWMKSNKSIWSILLSNIWMLLPKKIKKYFSQHFGSNSLSENMDISNMNPKEKIFIQITKTIIKETSDNYQTDTVVSYLLQ